MITLTPTVHERLARCGTHVHVDGLAGELTELFVVSPDATRTRYQVEGIAGAYDFVVAPLAAGDTIVARQTLGSDTTPESPPVVVENVHLPLDTGPRLPVRHGSASYGRYLTGAILPPSIRDITVHTQHAGGTGANTTVVDNFGEDDEVAEVRAEVPNNKAQNTMGLG